MGYPYAGFLLMCFLGGPYEGSLGSGFSVTTWVEGFGALPGSLTSGFKVES